MLQGPKIDDDAWVHEIRIEDTDEGIDVTLAVGTEERLNVPIAEAKQDLYTRLGANPEVMVRVAMEQPSTRKIVARTGEVAGYGWSAFEPAELRHPVEVTESEGSVVLANGVVRVEIDQAGGTFALDGLAGYGRLVDDGDLGDSYNYSPPQQDSVVDTPESVTVRVDERGPVRARARITDHLCVAGPRRGLVTGAWGSSGSPSTPTWSCGLTTPWCASPRPSSTRAGTTACASTCRCPNRRASPTRRAPSPSSPAGSPPRAGPTSSGSRPHPPTGS